MRYLLITLVVCFSIGCNGKAKNVNNALNNKLDSISYYMAEITRQRDSFYYLYVSYKNFFERCGCNVDGEKIIHQFVSEFIKRKDDSLLNKR